MKKRTVGFYITGTLISIIMLVPIIWGFLLSFKDNFGIFQNPFGLPASIDFSKYIDTFKTAHLGRLFLNSFIVTIISVSIAIVFVFISSYSIARLTMKGTKMNNTFYYLFLAATGVPIFAVLMTIYSITLKLGNLNSAIGIDSLLGLVLPYVAIQIPFLTLIFVGGLKSVPRELEEAAIIDGCSLGGIMFRIVLPTIKPVFITAFILTFLGVWNEYPISSILLSSQKNFTIPLAMSFFKDNYSADFGAMLRGIMMILVPQAVFYFIFQKQVIEGMATTGIKG